MRDTYEGFLRGASMKEGEAAGFAVMLAGESKSYSGVKAVFSQQVLAAMLLFLRGK